MRLFLVVKTSSSYVDIKLHVHIYGYGWDIPGIPYAFKKVMLLSSRKGYLTIRYNYYYAADA